MIGKGIMERFRLLGDTIEKIEGLGFMEDLNLDWLIEESNIKYLDSNIRQYYYYFPKDIGTVVFRQQIMKALDDAEMEEAIRKLIERIRKAKEYENISNSVENIGSKAHWYLMAVYTYFKALDECIRFLESKKITSEGLQNFLIECKKFMSEAEAQKNYNCVGQLYREIASIRYSICLEKEQLRVLSENHQENIVGRLRNLIPVDMELEEVIPRILPGSNESEWLEEKIFSVLERRNKELFANMRLFAEECSDFFCERIWQFCEEFSFYLSFLDLRHYMESYGHHFCYPVFQDTGMEVIGGYDLALGYKNQKEGKRVVSNDYFLQGEERFFVITGPNQGGKTTFGRSVGQLVYFAKMGFPVPAQTAKIPFFADIITHFSREESMESGHGKLKEELIRLAPIMKNNQSDLFVIANELFTSAATYDAKIMGQRVIRHFLGQGSYGVYVTHIGELAEEGDGVVSMVASLESKETEIRSYRVVRNCAEQKGYVEMLVTQYGLSYDEIVRRVRLV